MKEEHADVTNAQRRLFDELVGKLWKKMNTGGRQKI